MKLLKKYSEFLKESVDELAKSIADLAEDDDFAKSLIAQHVESDTTVSLENALRFLPESKLEFIKNQIIKNKKNVEEEPAQIIANTILENVELGGKNLFKCFLKTITALGQKNISSKPDLTPKDFIIYFCTDFIEKEDLESVFSRYDFFEENLSKIGILSSYQLYYGIKDGLSLEYGILNGAQNIPMGEFKITSGVYKSLDDISSPALVSFKLFLQEFDFERIKLIDKIKSAMVQFKPGYFEKNNFLIDKDILNFGYYGIGKWDNGKIDEGELANLKTNFKNFLMNHKWSDNVQINLKPDRFWIYFKFKFK